MRGGHTRQGIKPCLHPLMAVLAEVRLVAQPWLRPGNASCASNVTAFFLDLCVNLPRQVRLRGVRADSGLCLPELLAGFVFPTFCLKTFWESEAALAWQA